jgi:hypothetical protein
MPRLLIGIGIMFVAAGLIAWCAERAGLRLGHLPGDIALGRGGARFYFPVVTCLLLSAALTLLLWIAGMVKR